MTTVQVEDPRRLDVGAVQLRGVHGPREKAAPERKHPLSGGRVDIDDDHMVLRPLPRHQPAGVDAGFLQRPPAVLAEIVRAHGVDEAGAEPERRGDEAGRPGGAAIGESEVEKTPRILPDRHAVHPQHDIDDGEAEAYDVQATLQAAYLEPRPEPAAVSCRSRRRSSFSMPGRTSGSAMASRPT